MKTHGIGEPVPFNVAGKKGRFWRNVESDEPLRVVFVMPVRGTTAIVDTDLDHEFGTHALQRLIHRRDKWRTLVDVDEIVAAGRRCVNAVAKA